MRIRILLALFAAFCQFADVYAEDYCYGYTSPSNPFLCYKHGNCVWWAAYKRPDLKAHMLKDAGKWYGDAIAEGLPTGNVPRVGAIVVFNGVADSNGNRYGHVAYVEEVHDDGTFTVSQMDYYGTYGDGMTKKVYSMGDLGGVKGFIYETYAITDVNGRSVLRWNGDDGHFAFCEDGYNYHLYAWDNGRLHVTKLSVNDGRKFCDNASVFGSHDIDLGVYAKTGRIFSDAAGGYFDDSLDVSATPHPNITLDFDVLGPDGKERKAEHGALLIAGETVTLRAEACNDGKTDAADGRVKNGEKSDTRFWVRLPGSGSWTDIGREETKDSHLRAGDCHVEKKTYRIPDAVGSTIGFRAKVDDRSEIDESREEDNQSRDELFTIGAPPRKATESADGRFVWSSAGPVSGRVCTQIVEAADPHTWADNYFCSDRDYGIQWRSWGKIPGMHCTQITEAADPHTWGDNYLCVPYGSTLHFRWSSAGPIAGMDCTQWLETADPHTWSDNYLCHTIGAPIPAPPPPVHSGPIRWAVHPNKCLDVSGGNTRNGTQLQTWDCVNDGTHPNMQFILPQGGRGPIRWATHPNKCLDISNGGTHNGNRVQIWDCVNNGTHPNMQFIVPINGQGPIRWAIHPNKCLDVSGGRTNNGNAVLTYDCVWNGTHPNMQFQTQ